MISWIKPSDPETIPAYWYRMSLFCMVLRPGTQTSLEALLRHKYTLGIITNGQTHLQNVTLDSMQTRSCFATTAISEECGFRKSDRHIFELALYRLVVRPEQTVFVGDSSEADIQGAVTVDCLPSGLQLESIGQRAIHHQIIKLTKSLTVNAAEPGIRIRAIRT